VTLIQQLAHKDELLIKYKAEISQNEIDILSLKFRLSQLEKLIYGSKSERHVSDLPNGQLDLFIPIELDQTTQEVEQVPTETVSYTRKKRKPHPGRNAIPNHLPVNEITLEPDVDTKDLKKIGEQITTTLEYTPASLICKRVIRPKYKDEESGKIHIADLPCRALPKSIAEASLLSYLFVSKFCDHLPFYRLRQMFKRDYDLELASSTINDWFIACCTLLKPLYDCMKIKLLDSEYIQADESPIKVLDKDKKQATHQGYQWVYRNPENGIVFFQYRKGRGMHGPKEILKDYNGYIQCDGYVIYDKLAKIYPSIILVGCLAHSRRKFVEAIKSDAARANYAINIYKEIYRHDSISKQLDVDQRLAYRIKHIKPIMVSFKIWLEEHHDKLAPKSPIAKAIYYALNQWHKLINIFKDGKIELDNNAIENKIRPLALGRKNYLFAGSHDGGQRIAIMYTFFATCKHHNVNPFEWLKYVLDNIAEAKMSDLDKFLPQNFKCDLPCF
jgi:transposase